MIKDEIKKALYECEDKKYKDFQSKLIPTVNIDTVIGVRTPELKRLAKIYVKNEEIRDFLEELPHEFFDENQLHAFIISEIKDFDKCMEMVEAFLPYIDNWATCDQLSPKVFKKDKSTLLKHIKKWLDSDKTYTIRFGIGMLMQHFLDESFDSTYPDLVLKVKSDEYYVNMMIAWYFATALAKQYDNVLPFIEEKNLDTWTHNKVIQKAVESYRITDEQKKYLKSLKR